MITTLCCFVGLIFLVVSLLAVTHWAFRHEEGEGLAIVGAVLILAILIMFVYTVVAFVTIPYRADAEERNIIVVDKWQENEDYYFMDECETVYKICHRFSFQNIEPTAGSFYKRYNDLILNEEYTVEVLFTSIDGYEVCINELRKGEIKEGKMSRSDKEFNPIDNIMERLRMVRGRATLLGEGRLKDVILWSNEQVLDYCKEEGDGIEK